MRGLELAPQYRQGRTQLVRSIRDETLGTANGLLQPREHVIDGDRQSLQLIAAANERHTPAQILLRDFLCLLSDPVDGSSARRTRTSPPIAATHTVMGRPISSNTRTLCRVSSIGADDAPTSIR